MSGNRARVKQRVQHRVVKAKTKPDHGRVQLEVKSGGPDSGLPVAIVEVGEDWTPVPLIDRLVSIRKTKV